MKFQKLKILLLVTMRKCLIRAGPLPWLTSESWIFHRSSLKKTGSHRASVKSVASGKIDFAAVDAQSWRFIKKYDKFSINVRVLDHTNPTPGLPFITSQNGLKENLFSAIKKAIEVLSEKYRSILYLNDFLIIEEEKYLKSLR